MPSATTHPCDRVHRTFQTLAECCWPHAAWVAGDGPWAVLAHCDMLSVTLCGTREAARAQRARIDEVPCCRDCDGRHEIVELVLPDDDEPATRRRSPWRALSSS